MRNRDEPIDAGAELDELEAQRNQQGASSAAGGRGMSQLGATRRRMTPGTKSLLTVVLVCALCIGGAFSYKAFKLKQASGESQAAAATATVKNNLPPLKQEAAAAPDDPPPPAAPPPEQVQQTQQTQQTQQKPQKTPAELLHERRLSGGFGSEQADSQAQAGSPVPPGTPSAAPGAGGDSGGVLAGRLQPLRLRPSVAGRLADPDYMLTMGTPLDCILQTRIDSTVPGLIECYFDRDIYSASGRVVLLDRQTKLVGHWQGGIMQGQARIFIAWGRAETPAPNHVLVNLDSPATGPLGEGGIGGHVDTHFWQRFGGAIMLSLIDDIAAAARPSYGSGNQISFGNTANAAGDVAGKALENSINIPPTLTEHHGKRVAVMLARDLDFRDVYELRSK